jgi:hypothetical protein
MFCCLFAIIKTEIVRYVQTNTERGTMKTKTVISVSRRNLSQIGVHVFGLKDICKKRK